MSSELRSNGPEIDPNNPLKSIETAWDRHRFKIKVVNPANKRKYNVIVVGTGLAGASAAATLAGAKWSERRNRGEPLRRDGKHP